MLNSKRLRENAKQMQKRIQSRLRITWDKTGAHLHPSLRSQEALQLHFLDFLYKFMNISHVQHHHHFHHNQLTPSSSKLLPPIQRAWLGDHWWNPGERPPTPLWPATIRSYIIYCLNVCVLSSSRQSDLMSFVVITYTSIINNAKIGSYIIYCVRCVIITWISIIHTIWSSLICTAL